MGKTFIIIPKPILMTIVETLRKHSTIGMPAREQEVKLMPMILTSINTNAPLSLRTPNNANDFIYVDDVAELFSSVINIEFPSGVYNLGSGKATPVIDIYRQAEYIVNNSDLLTLKLISETKNSKVDVCFWANTSQAKKYLGWKPKVNLVKGIKKTWESLKNESD